MRPIATCALLIAALAACAPIPDRGEDAVPLEFDVPVNRDLAATVPAQVRADGVLTFGTDPSFPPMEYMTDDDRLTGVDIALAQAIAATLDLRPSFRLDAFTALEPGVRVGRYDVGISALTITPGRTLDTDTVMYLVAGSQLVRRPGTVLPPDLCGTTVGAEEGSVQIGQLADRSQACLSEGKERIVIGAADGWQDARDTLLAGGTDAVLADSPAAQALAATRPGELEAVGEPQDPQPYGMLIGPPDLAAAVRSALIVLIADGTYDEILASAAIYDGAVAEPVLLPAGTPRPADAIPGRLVQPPRG